MLVLDSKARKQIENLKKKADAFPLPAEILEASASQANIEDDFVRAAQLRALMANCTINLDYHYAVTYCIEEQPYGFARHLSVTVEQFGKAPPPEAIRLLMDEFGFQNPMGRCLVYEDKFAKEMLTVNVIEPLEPTPSFQQELQKRTMPRMLVA